MESLDRITHALGDPKALWKLRRGTRTVAAVARWSHRGAIIDLNGADAYQVVFNVSGGQVVDLPNHAEAHRKIRAGSIGINSPEGAGLIRVYGQADTLQILITPNFATSTQGDSTATELSLATAKAGLQAAAVQALVAVESRTGTNQGELERIVLKAATCLSLSLLSPRVSQGGLSPTARRRVSAVFPDWLTDTKKPSPRVKDMATAAGLSLYHFIRSYKRTEGQTPHARLLAARIDYALELLLQTESSINWISDGTGFSSPSHFVSTFKRYMGVTPGAFRHAIRSRP